MWLVQSGVPCVLCVFCASVCVCVCLFLFLFVRALIAFVLAPHGQPLPPSPDLAPRAPQQYPPLPGILYADVGVDLSNILVEDMPILGMFSRIMMETGTSEMDRVQLSRRIGSQTGGVYATFLADQPSAGGAVADPASLKQYLFLRGKVSPFEAGWAFLLLQKHMMSFFVVEVLFQ